MMQTAPPAIQAQVAAAVEVPERPLLAPNVQLMGELQDSGFADRQWLIQRDGQFIQVTELLYRLIEQIDGGRTLEEIAEGVTEATEWLVTADDVRHLVRTRLVPLGIVATSDGSVAPRPEDQSRSPLQVNARLRILSPRVLQTIAGLLQLLYAPVVLIPALVFIALAHGWLYFVHGVDRSVINVLSTPWLLLVVLPIVVISAIFHEFGHAAGLQYSGGKVRGMGAGFYLVYPTFYTDTTDAYRLGRWARLRTDLGGFYFHLIFSLGIIVLYLLSGQEFLLIIVLLINFDILYQCIPYMRLDGYWALADITGVPDFFSQMSPLVRGKLPRLKPWVTVAFACYMIIAIPMLAILLLVMVTNVPLIVTTTWGSLSNLVQELSNARSSSDLLGMAAAVMQMLILSLPLLGIAYFLHSLTLRPMKAIWNWSRPTPLRRVVGTLGGAALVGVVAFLWFPWLPFAALPTGPAGTESFVVNERSHVRTPVAYSQTPPVGGNHFPFWQNCGFYDAPIPNETAVHSIEHGAVWITYRPDLSEEQVASLRELARRQSHVLVSPFTELSAPVMASAWGKQLSLESADDPRLDEFLQAFRLGRQAPEPGERCDGGVGDPQ